MTAPDAADLLVADYLKRLDSALGDAPPEQRHEVMEDISEHISSVRAEDDVRSEALTRQVLERLGTPEEIAAELQQPAPARSRGLVEIAAIALLLVGGLILPVLGWILGAVLLWTSRIWSRRDKVIGTLLLPGGLLIAYLLLALPIGGSACPDSVHRSAVQPRLPTSSGGIFDSCGQAGTATHWLLGALVVLAIVIPVLTAIHLGRQLHKRDRSLQSQKE
jgi:HAAS